MAIPTDELARFAERMNLTTAQAEDLLRSLRNASGGADRAANAFDVSSMAASRLTASQQQLLQSGSALGSAFVQTTKSLAQVPEQIAAAANPTQAVSSIISMVTGFAATTAQVSGGLIGSAIGTAFGPLGALIGGLGGRIAGQLAGVGIELKGAIINFFLRGAQVVIDSFTQLSSVGITFAGSLESMREMSKQTGLSFETLSKIAVDNAQNLAILGGGTEGALKLVTNTSNSLGNTLLALYGGFTNLNAEVADYLAARRRQGVSEMATDTQLIQQTGEYLYMMKELSALTGKSAKMVRSEIEQRTKNAATQIALDEMTESERKNFEYQLGLLPEGLRSVYTDLVVAQKTGNTAILTEGLKMGATMPGIYNKLENMVSTLGMAPDEMKERFGREASALVDETRNYRKEFRDQLYLFSTGRISSDVVKNIDTVLSSLGENLGRLKTLPQDIKTFGEQIGVLKTNSQNFVDQIGLINKEQEKIRIALNNMVTDAGRFNFALGITTTVLEITNEIINGISDLLPSFINKEGAEKMKERLRTEVQKDPQSRSLQNQIDAYQRTISAFNKDISAIDAEIQNRNTQDAVRNELILQKQYTENQIKKLEEYVKKLQETQDEIRKSKRQNSSTGNATQATSNVSSTDPKFLGTETKPIIVTMTDFTEKLLPLIDKQNTTIIALERTLDRQTDQIKRVMDRVG